MPAFNSGPKRRPLPQDVLLPHKLIEAPRPHPHSQGRIASYLALTGFLRTVE
jgi:hypothetical protein